MTDRISRDFYKLLSLPEKCLTCGERNLAVKDKCSMKCEPIPLTEIVEENESSALPLGLP